MNDNTAKFFGNLIAKIIKTFVEVFLQGKHESKVKLVSWRARYVERRNQRIARSAMRKSVDILCDKDKARDNKT